MKNNHNNIKNKKQIRFLKLTQDIVFKSFFSRNKQVLISLLKSFLPIKNEIAKITILNLEKRDKKHNKAKVSSDSKTLHSGKQKENKLDFKESLFYPNKLNKKQIVLDLRVKLSTGENINVEMQTISQKHFLKRILFYWSKLYSQDLEKGESYDKIHPAYSLIFTTFPILDIRIKDFMSSFSIRRDKKPYQLFNEDLKIVIVELSKLNKTYNELLDLKEKWCYILRESSNITKKEYKCLSKDEDIKMALKHLNKLSRDEELYQEAFTEQINKVAYDLDRSGLLEEGMQKGIQQGIQQGIKEGRKETALNMLKEGFEVSIISKVTGLAEVEILKLKK
ncbi:MAG: Rpn family recombination-promoting nuclease/putative transposase [Bdellovibrionaceae bacterium]|nr:Rpn family recombination-promoting nuclease/putative transposase [Pseudobdellovibrionaceae bacterium]